MAQSGYKVTFWKGTREVFRRLVDGGRLEPQRIYFVGNSQRCGEGLCESEYGVLYVATAKDRAVRFGIFSADSTISVDDIMAEVEKKAAAADISKVGFSGLAADLLDFPELIQAVNADDVSKTITAVTNKGGENIILQSITNEEIDEICV